ncbi:biotin/lipoyl-containing protein [Thalassotalea sp. PS06]|uniref:biotin/lipoyl-containing protein n=1 Tax=Thalassotalea sp. PS06 TaxID=2594005 RepID=UPI0011658069|nr:biotin/lipoyl-containing protein [Thalassotalea sp. PS06]QDP02621.1 HlyD family efflux transporter periplasmic adaptor subunit [Thalassotalea sp. PS06]
MNIDIKIPEFGDKNESAVVLDIYVNQGMQVKKEDILFNVETDKVVLEVTAPETGTISQMMIEAGASVTSGQLVMQLSDNRPEFAVTADDDVAVSGSGSEQDAQLLEKHSDVSADSEAISADTDPATESEPAKDPQPEKVAPKSAATDQEPEQETEHVEVPEPAPVPQPSEKPNDIPTTTKFSAWQIALLFVAICAIGLLISAI